MGRLVATPELKHTQNGLAVTSFSLAVGRNFSRQGEDRATDFIDIVAWRTNAEFAAKYFSKGQLIAVEGSLQTRTYQDKNGSNRKVCEVVVDHFYFAESKKDFAAYDASSSKSSIDNSPVVQNVESEGFEQGELDLTEIPLDDGDLPF